MRVRWQRLWYTRTYCSIVSMKKKYQCVMGLNTIHTRISRQEGSTFEEEDEKSYCTINDEEVEADSRTHVNVAFFFLIWL